VNTPGITAAPQGPMGVGWAFGASLAVHGVVLAAIVFGWGTSLPVRVPIMDVELVVAVPGGDGTGEPGAIPAPPAATTAAQPPDDAHERTAEAPAERQSTTNDVPSLLPDPDSPPPVRSEDWRAHPETMPAAPAAPQPSPKAIPSRPIAPRATASPAPQRTPQSVAPVPGPVAPALQAGTGAAGPPDTAGSGPSGGGARLVRHVPPVYPPLARERGLEGRVVVRLMVGVDGMPTEVRVAYGSSVEALDAAALDAVRQWRFEPERRAGVGLPEERLAPVVFRLRR
jgi:protein TonB